MSRYSLLVGAFLISANAKADESYTSCFMNGRNDPYYAVKEDALYIEKKALTSDITITCDKIVGRKKPAMLDLAKKFFNKEPISKSDRYEVILNPAASSWGLSIPKNLEGREFVFKSLRSDFLGIKGYDQAKLFLNDKIEVHGRGRGQGRYLQRISKLESHNSVPQIIETQDISKVKSQLVCASSLAGVTQDCARGLQKVVQWLKADAISLPDVMDRVLMDKKFEAGIADAALKMMDKAEKKQSGSTHMFDHLVNSFKKVGCTDKEANRNAWDAIGVISTAGPNLESRFELIGTDYSRKSMMSLIAISRTTPYLDLLSEKSADGMYSYPKGMAKTCDNGKNYHFWMTAYFANRLVKEEGLSPKDAAYAAFSAEKGYQMFYSTTSRNPNEVFEKQPFDNRLNSMRLDMTLATAGAMYGARGDVKNIDEGMAHMINASNPPVKKPDGLRWENNMVNGYIYFEKVMAPDSVLNTWMK